MKIKRIFLFLFLLGWLNVVCGQDTGLERYIKQISNSQLIGHCEYIWKVSLVSKSADSLISEATQMPIPQQRKMVTEMIIPLLTDTSQGIALHYVLCEIWRRRLPFGSQADQSSELIEVYHGGLTFYQKGDLMFADFKDLLANQNKWKAYLNK